VDPSCSDQFGQVIVALSVDCGVDLTETQDLQLRLDAAVSVAKAGLADLEQLRDRVRAYELTVHGHKPLDFAEFLS